MKLRAIYDSLVSCNGDNAKELFYKLFGVEYSDETAQILHSARSKVKDQIRILSQTKSDSMESISFESLVVMVETSRGIAIDGDTKLSKFKNIYDAELKKWKNG